MIPPGFPALLKQKRKEKGLTLKDVAEELSLTIGYISRLENNQSSPSLDVLQKLMEFYQIPVHFNVVINETEEEIDVARIPKPMELKQCLRQRPILLNDQVLSPSEIEAIIQLITTIQTQNVSISAIQQFVQTLSK